MSIISVVIPVYNGERNIRETIQSILEQSLSSLEIIVINDGSKDSTIEIVSSLKDPRIKVFSYSNAGVAASRNRGIAQTSGEYISFIDADDLWTPDKLESQLQALKANPQAAVAYSWNDCIDEFSNFSRKGCHISANGNIYANLLLGNILENGSNPLIRRQALIEVGGFDESLSTAADWDMWLRLAKRYPFVVIPSAQVLYRISSNSMSSNVEQHEEEYLKVIEQAFTQAPESLQYLKKHSFANLYKYLTFKAVEAFPERRRAIIAKHFLWNSVKNDPSLLSSRVIWKVLFRIAVMSLLSPDQAQSLLTKAQGLTNTTTLLGYLRLDPLEI